MAPLDPEDLTPEQIAELGEEMRKTIIEGLKEKIDSPDTRLRGLEILLLMQSSGISFATIIGMSIESVKAILRTAPFKEVREHYRDSIIKAVMEEE